MVSVFRSKPWPESLHCVLGQDTLLSPSLSPPRCIKMGTSKFNVGGVTGFSQKFEVEGESFVVDGTEVIYTSCNLT